MDGPVDKKRIGVLVVAYNAASTLAKVLDRIPTEIRPDIEEVIVSDDHSQDSTYLVGLGYQQQSDLPITLIRQPTNLGYGGNQKAGYNLAIEHGLDIVVMLHGDGQYAPESLPEILAPLLNEEADAVFGSRTMIKGAARKGGMPLYKFAGNRILSRFENAALGTNLSEFHSGYRAYSVSALKQLPFEKNSDGFNFDTQIIIQTARRRHAHRRGPHPHLLRRRNLLRRRPDDTPQMSPRTSSPTGCRRRASATGAVSRSARSTNSSRATTAHTAGFRSSCSADRRAGSSISGVRAACSPSGCDEWATTSSASTSTRSTGCASGPTPSSRLTSTKESRPTSALASTSSWRRTSSSTWSTPGP